MHDPPCARCGAAMTTLATAYRCPACGSTVLKRSFDAAPGKARDPTASLLSARATR